MNRRIALLSGVFACAISLASPVVAKTPAGRAMVVADEPAVASVGIRVLKRGGSAIDAAVAMQAALSPGRAAELGLRRRFLHALLRCEDRQGDGL